MPKEKEYIYDTGHYILWFENADEAVTFAKELEVKNILCIEGDIYEENKGNEAWICVLAICDICKRQSIFFASTEIYENGISGIECRECGNMSVFPKEGSFEDA